MMNIEHYYPNAAWNENSECGRICLFWVPLAPRLFEV